MRNRRPGVFNFSFKILIQYSALQKTAKTATNKKKGEIKKDIFCTEVEASQSVILQNLSIIAINIIVEHIPEKIKFLFHFLSNVFLYLKYCVILIKNKTNIPNKSPSTLYNFIPFSSSANLLLKILFTTGKEVKILTTKAKEKVRANQ